MFQNKSLRNVNKEGGNYVIKNFGDQFSELKVEVVRKKAIETVYMRTDSKGKRSTKIIRQMEILGNTLGPRQLTYVPKVITSINRGRNFSCSRY